MERLIDSVTQLIINEDTESQNPIDFYNHWRNVSGIRISDSKTAYNVLHYISMALGTNKRILQKSLEVDYGKKKKD